MENNQPASPRDTATHAVAHFVPASHRLRIDGWTPENQRLFCETLADCGLVREAAAAVGMTPQTAYRLRRRAEGKGFAMAWDAALYLARQRLMDMALERAVDGCVETIIDGEGKIVQQRRKQDSRQLLAIIGKLDAGLQRTITTRNIADEFDGFLDCMEADANAATRISGNGQSPVIAAPHNVRLFLDERVPDSHFDKKEYRDTIGTVQRNYRLVLSRQGSGE
jgi:hypothetical protein